MSELQVHVDHIAHNLSNNVINPIEDGIEPSAFDWLQDALDIEYIVNGKGEYLGARVLVSFGGPNIWVDTRKQIVDGYWWSDTKSARYTDSIGLDEALRELWECR